MAQERKPSPLSKATSIGPDPRAEAEAKAMQMVAEMVEGMGGGGIAGMAKKVGGKVGKAALKKLPDWRQPSEVPQETFDEFMRFTQTMEPKSLGGDPLEMMDKLWQLFGKKGGR